MQSPDALRIYTTDGPAALGHYVACVVTAENGMAANAALRAQAIAARTFVLRAMRDDPRLGTEAKPIQSTERFQVAARHPATRPSLATADTNGIVCSYKGELIICNYVAGAIWTEQGKPGQDPTHTEKWVTYNEGKMGVAVKPTSLSNPGRPDNRGCMSQNGSDWLARHGSEHEAILRYFYGVDLDVGPLFGSLPSPNVPGAPTPSLPSQPQPSAPSGTSATTTNGSPLPLMALAALAKLAMEQ